MEEVSNLNEQHGDSTEAEIIAPPLTNIILYNVRDLNSTALINLCGNYGRVTMAKKHTTNPNMAFIEFATESDATMAVQKLNSKLGFGYRAEFQHPKNKSLASKANQTPVQQLDDEDWDKDILRRRFNYCLMPPLAIKFPQWKPLGTKANYLCPSAGSSLRAVDPELFFLIHEVMPVENAKQPDSKMAKQQKKRLGSQWKKGSGTGGEFRADRNEYKYTALSDEQLGRFGAVHHCVVCAGLGFLRCGKCDTHYCSTVHQKQHLAKHELVCAGKHSGLKPVKLAEVDNRLNVVTTPGSNVLTRDPLPSKAMVFITTVLTYDRIFVRSADPAVETAYLQTLANCERAGAFAKPAMEAAPITTGEIYLAPGAPSGTFGRVLLIEPGPVESKCVFIEHGTLSTVSNKALLLIDDPELKYRKVYVYRVCLAGITDEPGDREKAVKHLYKLQPHRLEMKYRMEADNMVDVQLRTSQGASVNDIINRLIIIPPMLFEKDHNTFIMYKDIAQTYPTLGENKSIMILNRTTALFDGRVNWIAMDDLPYLETLQEKLQHYGRKMSDFERDFTPRIGELCLVRCLDRWYRAVCHETAGDGKPAMFLCDYGCMMFVHLQDVRQIPPQLATSVRTHDGIVHNLLEAKAGGLKLDATLLDVYLQDNEPLTVDIWQETKRDSLLDTDEPEVYTILKIQDFSDYIASIMNCDERNDSDPLFK